MSDDDKSCFAQIQGRVSNLTLLNDLREWERHADIDPVAAELIGDAANEIERLAALAPGNGAVDRVGKYHADYSPVTAEEIAKEDPQLTELYARSRPAALDPVTVETLRPFAAVAEHDIGESETDEDIYQPMRSGYNRAPLITVGDLRRAKAALADSVTSTNATWQPSDTAPKDGRTFYALKWNGSFEDSLHWPLYWNGKEFEAVNNGEDTVDYFTHWMIPGPVTQTTEASK